MTIDERLLEAEARFDSDRQQVERVGQRPGDLVLPLPCPRVEQHVWDEGREHSDHECGDDARHPVRVDEESEQEAHARGAGLVGEHLLDRQLGLEAGEDDPPARQLETLHRRQRAHDPRADVAERLEQPVDQTRIRGGYGVERTHRRLGVGRDRRPAGEQPSPGNPETRSDENDGKKDHVGQTSTRMSRRIQTNPASISAPAAEIITMPTVSWNSGLM